MALAALAAGCGAAPEQEAAPPALPAPLADDLAGRADAVAAHLAAGAPCAAAGEADDLVHATVAAIQAGQVPPQLQEELLAGAQELLHRIECLPAASPPPAEPHDDGDDDRDDDRGEDDDEDEDEDERGEDKGKGRGKGRGNG